MMSNCKFQGVFYKINYNATKRRNLIIGFFATSP